MDRIIILTFIGVCVGQTPANTYLSLVGSPYLSSDPRQHDGYSANSFRAENPSDAFQQLGGLSDGIHNNSTPTIHGGNSAVGTSDTSINRNGSSDEESVYGGSLVPQSRLLVADRPQGIPSALSIPGLSHIVSFRNGPSPQSSLRGAPYVYDSFLSENRENPSLRAESRSDSEPQLNPQYSGPSLFSLPALATDAELRSSQPKYQPPAFRVVVDPSSFIRSPLLNAFPLRRTSLDEYYPSYESPSSHSSNQNGYIQQPTQGNSDPANYQFSYDVNAVEKGRSVQFAHEEQRGQDQAAGAYTVLLPDGQRQVVEYTADQDGYRPRVSYASENGESSTTENVNPPTDVYGNYESSVIAARSYLNGGRQPSSIQLHYQPQDIRNGSPTRPY